MSVRNSINLIGRLGNDPKLDTTPQGRAYARFSLATSEYYRDKQGNRIDNTQWHNCVIWGESAETLNKLVSKGQEVALTGKLTYNKYTDKQGVSQSRPEIVISEFALVGSKKDATA